MNASETRQKITELCDTARPMWLQVHEHSSKLAALSVEYHRQSLAEILGVVMTDGALIATLDIRNTPKTLDKSLAELKLSGLTGLKAIHDLQEGKIYVFKV